MKSTYVKFFSSIAILVFLLWMLLGCTLFLAAERQEGLQCYWTTDKTLCRDGFLNYNISINDEDGDLIITIYDGILYFNEDDMRLALMHIICSPEGRRLGLDISHIDYYIAEWVSHCVAYRHPVLAGQIIGEPIERIIERSLDVNLNLGDPYHDMYLDFYAWWNPQALYYLFDMPVSLAGSENCSRTCFLADSVI